MAKKQAQVRKRVLSQNPGGGLETPLHTRRGVGWGSQETRSAQENQKVHLR